VTTVRNEVTSRVMAPPGERFAPDAFQGAVGHLVKLMGDPTAFLSRARVIEDGKAAELTISHTVVIAGVSASQGW